MFSRLSWTLFTLSLVGVCSLAAQAGAAARAKARAEAERNFRSKLLQDRTDPFTHEHLRVAATEGVLLMPGECGPTMSYLNVAAARADKETTSVFLVLTHHASSWLFQSDEAPLQVLVDTTLLILPAVGKVRRDVVSAVAVTETKNYTVTRGQLAAMADADDVLVCIVGRDRACEGRVFPYALAVLGMFVGQVLADTR